MSVDRSNDELLEVKEFLNDGDLIALGSGNMVALYRIHNDAAQGEAEFEYVGIAALTGAHNKVRRRS